MRYLRASTIRVMARKTSVAPTSIHVVLRSSEPRGPGAACGSGAARGSGRHDQGIVGFGGLGRQRRERSRGDDTGHRHHQVADRDRPGAGRRHPAPESAHIARSSTPPRADSPTSGAPGLLDPQPVSPPGRKLRDAPARLPTQADQTLVSAFAMTFRPRASTPSFNPGYRLAPARGRHGAVLVPPGQRTPIAVSAGFSRLTMA
jgi:hypothetical protein